MVPTCWQEALLTNFKMAAIDMFAVIVVCWRRLVVYDSDVGVYGAVLVCD